MGVYTDLTSITLTSTEITALTTAGIDGKGLLQTAVEGAADLTEALTALKASIGTGANKSLITTEITALS